MEGAAKLGPAGRSQVQLGNEKIILGAMWKAKRAEAAAKKAGVAVV